jgi:hypothetical protein
MMIPTVVSYSRLVRVNPNLYAYAKIYLTIVKRVQSDIYTDYFSRFTTFYNLDKYMPQHS